MQHCQHVQVAKMEQSRFRCRANRTYIRHIFSAVFNACGWNVNFTEAKFPEVLDFSVKNDLEVSQQYAKGSPIHFTRANFVVVKSICTNWYRMASVFYLPTSLWS